MENTFVAIACNADLCATDRIAQRWREIITIGAVRRDYENRNKEASHE